MKKCLFILSVLVSSMAFAQEYPRHYLQFNVGDNLLNSRYSGTYNFFDAIDYVYYSPKDPLTWFDSYRGNYTSYEARIPITFSVQYFYAVKHWLHLGGEIYYSGDYYNISQAGTGKLLHKNCNVQFSILPSIRFQYLDRRFVGLYSGIALGLYTNYQSYYSENHTEYHLAWQTTFIGLRVGNKAFWTLELGAGLKGFFTTGVGFRL